MRQRPGLRSASDAATDGRRAAAEDRYLVRRSPFSPARAATAFAPPDRRAAVPLGHPEFGKEWNGVFYRTKQVRPIFVEEPAEIVVVTVYVYYLAGER